MPHSILPPSPSFNKQELKTQESSSNLSSKIKSSNSEEYREQKYSYKAVSPGEKRSGKGAVPLNLHRYLNRFQMSSLREMETFGWRLAFVRRTESNETVVVAKHSQQGFGLLEHDGSINTSVSIGIRSN